jgi:AcrR family transcriptional regulator
MRSPDGHRTLGPRPSRAQEAQDPASDARRGAPTGDRAGYDAVTVEDIADAAEVSTRTFFNYFTSKEDALAGIDPDEISEVVQTLAARPDDEEPLAALRAVLLARAAEKADRRDQLRAKMRLVRAHPALLEAFHAGWSRYERAMVEVVARRCGLDPDEDAYPAVVVAAALAVARTVSLRWRDAPGDSSLHDLLSTAFDDLARGLAPPPTSPRGPWRAS